MLFNFGQGRFKPTSISVGPSRTMGPTVNARTNIWQDSKPRPTETLKPSKPRNVENSTGSINVNPSTSPTTSSTPISPGGDMRDYVNDVVRKQKEIAQNYFNSSGNTTQKFEDLWNTGDYLNQRRALFGQFGLDYNKDYRE